MQGQFDGQSSQISGQSAQFAQSHQPAQLLTPQNVQQQAHPPKEGVTKQSTISLALQTIINQISKGQQITSQQQLQQFIRENPNIVKHLLIQQKQLHQKQAKEKAAALNEDTVPGQSSGLSTEQPIQLMNASNSQQVAVEAFGAWPVASEGQQTVTSREQVVSGGLGAAAMQLAYSRQQKLQQLVQQSRIEPSTTSAGQARLELLQTAQSQQLGQMGSTQNEQQLIQANYQQQLHHQQVQPESVQTSHIGASGLVSISQQQQCGTRVGVQAQLPTGQQSSLAVEKALVKPLPNSRQQAMQRISIIAQKQLQLIQARVNTINANPTPTDQQRNMLVQLHAMQQKIVLQARQQLAPYVTAAAQEKAQANVSMQQVPANSTATTITQPTNETGNMALSVNELQQLTQGRQQLASALATAAAIQASLKSGAQTGGAPLTPQQSIMVRELQENLGRMTPEQKELFYRHQQKLLTKMQAQARLTGSPSAAPPVEVKQPDAAHLKNITIKPALSTKPSPRDSPRGSPKDSTSKHDKEKHKHKSKHKDRDKEKPHKKPKASLIAKQMAQELSSLDKIDTRTPFKVASQAILKLLPFHVCQDDTPTEEQLTKADEIFEAKCTALMAKKQKMLNKYQLLMYNESMRLRPSAEVVMIERMFLSDERSKLEVDRRKAHADQELLKNVNRLPDISRISTSSNGDAEPTESPPNTTTTTSFNRIDADKLQCHSVVPSAKMPNIAPEMVARSQSTRVDMPFTSNGSMDEDPISSSDSIKHDPDSAQRLPLKKRKIDISSYSEDPTENHVRLKLKRKLEAEALISQNNARLRISTESVDNALATRNTYQNAFMTTLQIQPQEEATDDDEVIVVGLEEQMNCAINSILDLQRHESGKHRQPKREPSLDPVTQPQRDLPGVNFDEPPSSLAGLDFDTQADSISYDLGNMSSEFPFYDDQSQFLPPPANVDIFRTDISSSSYPPAPEQGIMDAMNDVDSSPCKDPEAMIEEQPYEMEEDCVAPDESSVVAQFQNELSMLQHRDEDAMEPACYPSSGEENTETDPDLEAAVNSILF